MRKIFFFLSELLVVYFLWPKMRRDFSTYFLHLFGPKLYHQVGCHHHQGGRHHHQGGRHHQVQVQGQRGGGGGGEGGGRQQWRGDGWGQSQQKNRKKWRETGGKSDAKHFSQKKNLPLWKNSTIWFVVSTAGKECYLRIYQFIHILVIFVIYIIQIILFGFVLLPEFICILFVSSINS